MNLIKVFVLAFFNLILILSYQNCSQMDTDSEEGGSAQNSSSLNFTLVFSKVIQPQCIGCHSNFYPEGGVDLSSYQAALDSGTIVPGDALQSSFYTTMLNKEMPPEYPAPEGDIALIKKWIDEGARDANGIASIPQPSINAGTDFYIYEPQTSITFKATATIKGDSIKTILWTQLSGPVNVSILSPNSLNSVVNGITSYGDYEFKLYVQTNMGAEAFDTVKLRLNPKNNQLPVVGAGLDVNIQPPVTTATITASAADPDGSISAYDWEQTSGPASLTLSGTTTSTLLVSNITIQGTYGFKITVTDNEGASISDTVNVVLDPPPIPRSFSDINTNIFVPKCLNCHQGGNARGGYDMSTYAKIMSLVKINNANGSELYKRCYDNTMPPSRPLTKSEKDKIRD